GRIDVLYSPDAFGHPAAWPTVAREFGIRYGVVWRGLGGETGQERDLYRWRGLDDKEVLLWHLPPAGYEIGAALPADAERLFAAWAPVRGALAQRATRSEEHTSELQSLAYLVCRLLLEKKKKNTQKISNENH